MPETAAREAPGLDVGQHALHLGLGLGGKKLSEHPIEEIDVKLRGMMPWIKERALVDRNRN